MDECKEVCGNCKWHRHESIDNGWVCTNPDSDYIGDWTDYEDRCWEFEER